MSSLSVCGLSIVNIDIKLKKKDLEDFVQDLSQNIESGLNYEYLASVKDSKTRKGTSLITLKIENLDQPFEFSIMGEINKNAEVEFKPMKLGNVSGGFYESKQLPSDDDEVVQLFNSALKQLANANNGTYISLFSPTMAATVIVEGKDKSNRIKNIAFIDDRGRVYSGESVEDKNESDEDNESYYIPKYFINDWLNDNPQFKQKLQNVDKEDVIDYMGKFIVFQKQNDQVDASQFRDIFTQLGNMADLQSGFKDETLQTLSKLIL